LFASVERYQPSLQTEIATLDDLLDAKIVKAFWDVKKMHKTVWFISVTNCAASWSLSLINTSFLTKDCVLHLNLPKEGGGGI
jgi:hypothetical protein